MNKRDILIGGLFYSLPLWLILVPILLINFEKNDDIFILTLTFIVVTWAIGMNLMRIAHLENEIEHLKKKLNENKSP